MIRIVKRTCGWLIIAAFVGLIVWHAHHRHEIKELLGVIVGSAILLGLIRLLFWLLEDI